ncbi:MAG: zinc ABC transporter substrate-binding protein [Clostridiales bacterium]|nr:zinc ABC transporter substrate-binding protein [Clostridiales bacterium]
MKRKMIILLSFMAIIIITVFTIILYTNKNNKESEREDDGIRIVTSFYPVYVLTKNITDQIPHIEVDSLTDFSAGCLHDYQLTTKDMKLLSKADIFIINGGGIEGYLEGVLDNYPDITVIDLSPGISMLESMEHVGEDNPHVWLDPELYILQIKNAKKGIEQYIKSIETDTDLRENKGSRSINSDILSKLNSNTNDYIEKVDALVQEMNLMLDLVRDLTTNNKVSNKVVIFHDAFAYLAIKAGLDVVYTVEIDEDNPLSAGEIAEVIDIIKEENIQYLFAEEQHDSTISNRIHEETGANVYIIDSAVTGDGSKDSYLDAMKGNIDILSKAFK